MRTSREIQRERYSVKALRGDFDDIAAAGNESPRARVNAVLKAIDA